MASEPTSLIARRAVLDLLDVLRRSSRRVPTAGSALFQLGGTEFAHELEQHARVDVSA
jgi:hypothetical protein